MADTTTPPENHSKSTNTPAGTSSTITTITTITTAAINSRAARRGQLFDHIARGGRAEFAGEHDQAEHVAQTRDEVDEYHAHHDNDEEDDASSDTSDESTITLTPTKESGAAERVTEAEDEDIEMEEGDDEDEGDEDVDMEEDDMEEDDMEGDSE